MRRCERRFTQKSSPHKKNHKLTTSKKAKDREGKKNTSSTCIHLCEFYEPIQCFPNIYGKIHEIPVRFAVINNSHRKIHQIKFVTRINYRFTEWIQSDIYEYKYNIDIYCLVFTQVDCEMMCCELLLTDSFTV